MIKKGKMLIVFFSVIAISAINSVDWWYPDSTIEMYHCQSNIYGGTQGNACYIYVSPTVSGCNTKNYTGIVTSVFAIRQDDAPTRSTALAAFLAGKKVQIATWYSTTVNPTNGECTAAAISIKK